MQSFGLSRAILPFLIAAALLLLGIVTVFHGPTNLSPVSASAVDASVADSSAPVVVQSLVSTTSCYVTGDMVGDASPAAVTALVCP
jgi:hypothetical protein